ncbi:hypothetical protein IGI04_023510 [Brassica rapa subsp. trilocularis]|uniref:Retrotransposon gag domain-containing protein n=1 Tax=Brassica rapa subsp. trilocularis TaxID=1813537 RepID=A0ABQ7M412_BRACM|nr:hypothetical protein IGI04_023510 [Brassica rapa subsp. trilocularis]
MPYLTNQEGLNQEANFYGFYTQEGVQANWNWAKIFTEQEPSICEYPTLEGDLSSSNERPEAKPVIKFKSILSAFQKAKDQEKWTRKSEDKFNLPEPVKPVLHSPQLEANRFNQLQTRNWRPGDHLNQSGGIPEVLSCTRTQEISRFNGESLKSNRSYLWKDWTIFRFDPFQAIPIQPGEPDDVQTKPRHPGDIIQEPEEFYNFIPCTSPHRNKKIPIITKLPYLESLAFKLQQLFFYQGKDEISIYQAFKKVPRKLSYPLKPSRFKKNQVSHLEPKFHKRLQRLVSDFVSLLDLLKPWFHHFYQFVGYPPCAYNILVSELKLLTKLGKRNKPQGRRPQHGERRFGDAPEAGYVEPKPPDPSWITSHHTSSTYKYLTHSYLYFKSVNEVKIYSFSGSIWPDDYLSWKRTMDDWFSYQGVPKKERLAHAIKQLSGKAYSWWKRVDKTHGRSPEKVATNWKDLKDVMIRKYVTTLPTQETRRKYPRRFSNGVSKEAKKVVPQQGHRSLIYQDQIRPSQIPTVLYDKYQPYEVPKSMEKNLFSPDTLARYKEKSDKPILQGKAKVSPILDKFVYKSSPTGMSHLSLSKNVKTGPEVQKDTNLTSLLESKAVHDLRNKEIPSPKKEETTSQCVTLEMDQKIVQETMQSILLKEAKPKQCQEGGDDVVIRSATEPEVNPKPYLTSQGVNQDIRALKMPYLTNQEGLNHEDNFYGFYTHEGVQANWNWAKIFREKEVINFTTQRFLSPSICEYPTLEGDLSSSKERPEAKPVIKFKSILSAFQKVKYQEKWTRKSEDMFNFPEPVKPVLHSPQLEANRFNQLQTRNWRPGDHFKQSGGIPEVLSYTIIQEISRFNGESLKSNRRYLWKDWTIFRFDPFQAIPIQPGEPDDVQNKPRHPADIIQEPEEFYNFIPCTSPHRNKKIPIINKLPYLESLAFKLQQLFFYKGKDEISIYQAFKKVPRKLSYPLKPFRFKKNQVSHLEPKSHKRLQRLVSDFVSLLDLFPFFSSYERQN